MMDYNCTLNPGEDFANILVHHHKNNEKVSLLMDEGGWTRAEGLIKAMVEEGGKRYLILENDDRIDVSKVIAVNGFFRPDCSC